MNVMFTREDMEKCFEAGVAFARNVFLNPSNSEYIEKVIDAKVAKTPDCSSIRS